MLSLSPPVADLRQGDVCTVEQFPIWNLRDYSPVPTGGLRDHVILPTWQRIERAQDGQCLAIICTQCCDLENPRERVGIMLAPLMKVPARQGDDRYDRVMKSLRPEGDVWHYMQYAPLTLPDGRDVVADLSAATTIAPNREASELLRSTAVARLDDATRVQFRAKVSFMFGRNPDGQL